jgi:hypothetical protein
MCGLFRRGERDPVTGNVYSLPLMAVLGLLILLLVVLLVFREPLDDFLTSRFRSRTRSRDR